jgi:hypothetical protein
MMLKRLLSRVIPGFICLVLTLSNATAQGPARVPGDIIIHTQSPQALEEVLRRVAYLGETPTGLRIVRALAERSHIWLLHAPPHLVDDRMILNRIREVPGVIAAQFNHLLEDRSVPDDSNFGNQWQWNNQGQSGGTIGADIDMLKAWTITRGGTTAGGDTIVVAIVDNGINLNHSDFQGNLWVNHTEIPGNGIDDDNNGYIDDYLGWNTTQENDNVGINGSHGTPVSGMIGARGGNGVGVTGVNWFVKLMTIRPNSTQEALVIAAYSYALTQRQIYNETQGQAGALVVAINSSWGINYGQPEDAPIWCAFYDTLGIYGILSTAATANLNVNVDIVGDLPTACSSEYLISVTSTNHNDLKANAAYGKTTIDLAAPGQSVYTTHNNGGYSSTSGTSFASPTVAGLVALVYSSPCLNLGQRSLEDPAGTARFVRDAIYEGVDVLPHLEPLLVTGGRANAFKALSSVTRACFACPDPHDLKAEPTSQNEAIISWLDLGNSLSFDLRWRAVGEPDWILITDIQNPFVLSGLDNCLDYEVEVKAHCDGESSEWATAAFTSFGCCLPPTDLQVLGVTDTSVTITWINAPGADGLILSYLESGALDYVVEPGVMGNTFTFNGLKPCTAYSFQIASQCGQEESLLSAPVMVSTTGCLDCPAPDGFTLVSLTDTSVAFTWKNGPNVTSFSFAYLEAGAQDFVIYPNINDTFRIETGLSPCTKYTFEIRANCGSQQSPPAVLVVETAGCLTCADKPVCPSAGLDSDLEFIQAIQIGAFSNVSGNDGGYGNFTNLSFDLLTFNKYAYTLTPGFENNFSFNETWNVWVDFNQDGDFNDPGEHIIGPVTSINPVSGLFKVPGSALPGSTRMRVSMSFGAGPGPCGNFTFGEVEDYCVNIVLAPEPCDFVDATTLQGTTETSATISWTPVGTAVQYIVEYRALGAPDWLSLIAPASPFTLSGLEPCTEYELRVITDCDTAQSVPALPLYFRTKGCGACLDFLYCSAGPSNSPNQWIQEISLAGVTNTSGPNGGYAFFPDLAINLKTNHEYDLIIKPGATFNINQNYYRVFIDYTQNGIFNPFELAASADNTTSGEVILTFEIPSGALAGPTRLRVIMQSFGGDNNACAQFFTGEVEDYCVTIEKADPPCIPRKIQLDLLADTSVTLSWKNVIPADVFHLEYRIPDDSVWTIVTTTLNKVTLDDLLPCTSYEARMLTICSGDSTEYSPVLSFKTKGCGACLDSIYCDLFGQSASFEWIESVKLNTINNVSGSDQGYAFFDGITTNLDTTEMYTITVSPGFSFGAGNLWMTAWIDFNQDGQFSDNERILSALDNGPVSSTFTVPGVALGETRLRVALSLGLQNSACGSFFYGEVEDYCIRLSSREIPCLIPSYFDTVGVSATQASVAWDSVATSIGFILRFRELGGMGWAMEMPVLGNSFVFPGLQECTEYEVQLITICQNKLSDAGTLIFKTTCPSSLNELSPLSALRLYPNPFTEAPVLAFQSLSTGTWQMEIWDARGQLADHRPLAIQQGANQWVIEQAHSLPSGLYVLRLVHESGAVHTLRMIRQ